MNARFQIRPSTPVTFTTTEAPMKKKPRRRFLDPRSFFHGLTHELTLLTPVYARLHTAHPELAAYPTLPILIERLTKGPRDDAKKELLAALVALRQSSPHRLWIAVLLRAFRPMLAKLWKELFGTDDQERFALLLLGFQGALCHVDPRRDPVRIAMYVRQTTRRRAIVALTKELRWTDIGFGDEADQVADARAPDFPLRQRWREAQSLLRRGALHAFLRRTHPSMPPADRQRLYHDLRRTFRRALPTGSVAGSEVTP